MDIKQFMKAKDEKPLDNLVSDGGFCSILRTIACIGDSLASGEFEIIDADGKRHAEDMYDYSWGQFLARMAGCRVYNFSKGGMTAKEYCQSFAQDNGFWDKDKLAQGYIIAMGLNDIVGQKQEVGSIEDICLTDYKKNNETYAGYYGQIVQRIKEINPDARFFFVTFPKSGNADFDRIALMQSTLMNDMAKLFEHSYVIDLYKYGPEYNDEFKKQFYLEHHMNPCGYVLTAKMFVSYIDYIIRHNIDDFKAIGYWQRGFKFI